MDRIDQNDIQKGDHIRSEPSDKEGYVDTGGMRVLATEWVATGEEAGDEKYFVDNAVHYLILRPSRRVHTISEEVMSRFHTWWLGTKMHPDHDDKIAKFIDDVYDHDMIDLRIVEAAK